MDCETSETVCFDQLRADAWRVEIQQPNHSLRRKPKWVYIFRRRGCNANSQDQKTLKSVIWVCSWVVSGSVLWVRD